MIQNIRKVALLGMGTVGGGVYKIIEKQKNELIHKIGAELEISKVLVRNKGKYANLIAPEKLTDQWSDIIEDDSIELVVEVMGGIEPAATLNQCLAGNEITEVMGIINGTTNFILTKMSEEGMDFAEALQLATDLGYAEADPTADIEGHDAGRKLAILASLAFNSPVTFQNVYTEGISKISAKDIRYAHELGCEIKLLGIAKNTEDGIEVKVHPTMIPQSHPLAAVNDSYNAVFIHGDAVGDAMFYGRGAGELPTGSAVVGDILDVARNIQFHCTGRIGSSCYKNIPIKDIKETKSSYYVRMKLEDRAGTLAALAGVFGSNNVSISMLLQKTKDEKTADVVIVTYDVLEKQFMDSIIVISNMSMVKEISSIIRVYH